MQGTAGNIVPPDDFLPAVAETARSLGALFIADEMITGFGRTGRYWGTDHSGARADLVTIGKAFGGGFPLTGVVTTDAIAQAKPWSNPSGSSSSYGGNPLAAAAGAAALRAIDEERMVENARDVGALLLAELAPFVDDYPFVGHVRGRGMFLGVELVRDKATKEPLPRAATRRLFDELVRRGLFTMAYAPSFRLQPPLNTSADDAREAVAILREVFDVAKRESLWGLG
jgi:4-aminobutyrate aminotransferase-like enzyme